MNRWRTTEPRHQRRILNGLLILTSLFGFLEWGGNNQAFLFEAELDVLSRSFTDPVAVIHPPDFIADGRTDRATDYVVSRQSRSSANLLWDYRPWAIDHLDACNWFDRIELEDCGLYTTFPARGPVGFKGYKALWLSGVETRL
ncbi:MAG: hypothetical protein ACKOQY_07045 [Bacteroidota bacterium]